MNKLLVAFLVLMSCNVYSQDHQTEYLSVEELDRRLLYIQGKLDDERSHSYLWQHAWEGIYGVSSLVQLARATTADTSDDEVNFGVSAFKSAVAFGTMMLNPLPAIDGADSLSIQGNSNFPALTRTQKVEQLKRAEALLKRRAERAEGIHTWARHGSAILFNLATAGIISAYGNDRDAITSAIGGIIMSEINIWTQPSQGAQDWQDYQNLKTNNQWSWHLQPTLNGLVVSVNF